MTRTPAQTADPNILERAAAAVYGDRQRDYGHPREDYGRVAQMWSAVIGSTITPEQAAMMMCCVKISRLCNTPDHEDSWVDLAGYAAVGARIVGIDD